MDQLHRFRISRRRAIASLSVPVIAAALPAVTQAAGLAPARASQVASSTKSSYIYVNLNVNGANSVAGFARNADGSLTPLAGSPFTIGGTGTGSALGSQGAIQMTKDGRFLLAVDAASNQVSVLAVGSDGSLSPVSGSPFSSGGTNPVSIAAAKNAVYVANAGSTAAPGGANYTGFKLLGNGSLVPFAGSTFPLPDGLGLGDIVIDDKGEFLAGMRVAPSQIDSFTIGSQGVLTAAPGSPIAAQGLGPFGSGFRPGNSGQLFVTNAHNGTGLGTVSAFSVASNGALSSIGASPYPDFQTAPCWLSITPNGQYVFATNTGTGSVSSYAIASDGTLTLIGSTMLSGTSLGATDQQVDPSGSNLYVVESATNTLSILAISGGTLTEIPSSPVALPPGGHPSGIAIA